MKKLRFEGPRAEVGVLVEGQRVVHPRGKVREYPDAVADDLLQDPRNKFVDMDPAKDPRS